MKTPINLLGNGLGLAAMLAGSLAHAAVFTFDPDTPGINDGDDISTAFTGVTLSALSSGAVFASEFTLAPTGSLLFAWKNGEFLDDHWGRKDAPTLQADFVGFLAHTVSIDYLSDLGEVVLEAFDSNNIHLGTVVGTPDFDVRTLTFTTGARI